MGEETCLFAVFSYKHLDSDNQLSYLHSKQISWLTKVMQKTWSFSTSILPPYLWTWSANSKELKKNSYYREISEPYIASIL